MHKASQILVSRELLNTLFIVLKRMLRETGLATYARGTGTEACPELPPLIVRLDALKSTYCHR